MVSKNFDLNRADPSWLPVVVLMQLPASTRVRGLLRCHKSWRFWTQKHRTLWKLDMYSGYSEWEIWNGSSYYTYTSFCWCGVSKWNFGIFLDLGHLGTINDRACDTWHGCPPEILGKDGMFLKGQSCNGWSRIFFWGSRSNSGSDVLTCFGQDGDATKWESHSWYSYII